MPGPSFLSNLLIEEENIRDLRELVNATVINERIGDFHNVYQVNNGDPVAIIGAPDAVGVGDECGCNPTYATFGITNTLKRWDLGCWTAHLKVCYADMEGTIAEFALKKGTPIGDLNGTHVLSDVIAPKLAEAYSDMAWRIAWFADKSADTITNGGALTNGTDTDLFTMTDGLFAQIYALSHRTTITTNTKAAMTASGAATAVIDSLIIDANPGIFARDNACIYMTNAFATALTLDVRRLTQYTLDWQTVAQGVKMTEYNGCTIYAINALDRMIAAYENGANPYRAVLTTKGNLVLGTTKGDFVSDFDMYFDHITRNFYMYATGKMGAMIINNDLVQIAY